MSKIANTIDRIAYAVADSAIVRETARIGINTIARPIFTAEERRKINAEMDEERDAKRRK